MAETNKQTMDVKVLCIRNSSKLDGRLSNHQWFILGPKHMCFSFMHFMFWLWTVISLSHLLFIGCNLWKLNVISEYQKIWCWKSFALWNKSKSGWCLSICPPLLLHQFGREWRVRREFFSHIYLWHTRR